MFRKSVCRHSSGSDRVLNPRYILNRKDKGERYLKNIDTSPSVNILTAVGFEDHFGQSPSTNHLPLSHFAVCLSNLLTRLPNAIRVPWMRVLSRVRVDSLFCRDLDLSWEC
jgi:hypothetical protein